MKNIWDEISHKISNEKRMGLENFATHKNQTVKSNTTLPHCDIYEPTRTSSDRTTYNQTDHISV
jgi:hypothetical protein